MDLEDSTHRTPKRCVKRIDMLVNLLTSIKLIQIKKGVDVDVKIELQFVEFDKMAKRLVKFMEKIEDEDVLKKSSKSSKMHYGRCIKSLNLNIKPTKKVRNALERLNEELDEEVPEDPTVIMIDDMDDQNPTIH